MEAKTKKPTAKQLREKAAELREKKKPLTPIPQSFEVIEPDGQEQCGPSAPTFGTLETGYKLTDPSGIFDPTAAKPPVEKSEKKPPAEKVSETERRDNLMQTRGRLPDGAEFVLAYNAAAKLWTGTLQIPGMEPIRSTFRALFQLLENLDREYRRRKWERMNRGTT
jgi:hypothetical protein